MITSQTASPQAVGAPVPSLDVAAVYIGEPDIPAGMTIAEFRRTRTGGTSRRRRILRRLG
jgi:hypothetical protein